MSPPLVSQDVEGRLLDLERSIIIRALCILKTEKEIQELKEGGAPCEDIATKEDRLLVDRLDIKYLILRSRGILKSSGIAKPSTIDS